MSKLFFNLLLVMVSLTSYAEDWQLAKDKEGIQVFLATVPTSAYKAYRGETIITATPRQIAELLADIEGSCQLMFGCKKASLIEQKGYEYWTYSQINVTWPVTDRDLSLYSVASQQSDGTIIIKLAALPDKVPRNKEFVRVLKLTGFWELKPLTAHTTKVIYQVATEPNGSVPAWLVNSFVVDGPFETLKNVRMHLEKVDGLDSANLD